MYKCNYSRPPACGMLNAVQGKNEGTNGGQKRQLDRIVYSIEESEREDERERERENESN